MDKVLLADGRELFVYEILSEYKTKELFTAFQVNDTLILDKITPNNILEVCPVPYSFDKDGKMCYLLGDKDILCETLADEYNSRNGKYSELFNTECSSKDLPVTIVHIDGSIKNCTPSNITRQNGHEEPYISMDYYRSISHSQGLAELATQLYPFISMKRRYAKYIEKEFYGEHSHEYSDYPTSWNWLVDKFGNTENINRFVDNSLRECAAYSPKSKSDMKVYLISDVSMNEGRRLTAFMEAYLEDRGYEVFSPSRDIKIIPEDEEAEIRRTKLSECDLAVACITSSLGCFTGETVIRLIKGESMKIKDMKRRRSGYKILTYSTKQRAFVEGFTYGSLVVQKSSPISKVEFTTGEIVRCTADHPFLSVNNQYIEAKDLKPGTKIVSMFNSYVAEVKSYEETGSTEDVYGMEVMTENKNYVIGPAGAVVKNSQLEIGIGIGLWYDSKQQAVTKCQASLENLSEKDLAILNQKKPRIIVFSDNHAEMSQLESHCLRCCSSWNELSEYLRTVDELGIRYAR